MYVTINININRDPETGTSKPPPAHSQCKSNPVPAEEPPRVVPVPPYEGVVIDHDQLFVGNYCKLHNKTIQLMYKHKETIKHQKVEALIKGGKRKAKLSIQDLRDLFVPDSTVRRCCLCNLKFDFWPQFKAHMKSPLHTTALALYSHTAVIDDDIVEVLADASRNFQ